MLPKLGENIPNDPGANFYRSSIIGVDERHALRLRCTGGLFLLTLFEPQGSVNIIWNLDLLAKEIHDEECRENKPIRPTSAVAKKRMMDYNGRYD